MAAPTGRSVCVYVQTQSISTATGQVAEYVAVDIISNQGTFRSRQLNVWIPHQVQVCLDMNRN